MTNSCDYPLNRTDCEDLVEPEFYSYKYRVVGTIFQGAIFLSGVFGNVLVIIVVKRTQSMHTPTNYYLVSLAVADLTVLVYSVPVAISGLFLVSDTWILGDFGCKLFIFLQNLGINSSSLNLMAFTVERYIAICHPMMAYKMCTINRAKKIIFGVWIFSIVYCSPWLVLTWTRPLNIRGYPGVGRCDFKLSREKYLLVFFADIMMFYVIPLIVSSILYVLMGRTLLNTHRPSNSEHRKSSSSSRAQVVKMLAVIVALFATLWLPYRGMLVYNSVASLLNKQKFMDLWFLLFAKTCVFINSAINPILYNVMSSKFRAAFREFLICSTRSSRNSGQGGSSSTFNLSTIRSFRSSQNSAAIKRTDDPQIKDLGF
ncbi:unnamed protein product [Bemisia tabaci]|uniref:Thyrotropin-releasing hormone receptor n=1 Tax=Bemisia tabaci TaxID=7038 RepID=A0A9P0F5Y9_BEMTA|nr:unnamed protein product [Bemisia tabaci]